MQVRRFEHPDFTSNTFLLHPDSGADAWLIDAGEVREILQFPELNLRGVFLTHAHYDHIYGLNALLERFPHLMIYASSYTLESLKNPRQNLSFYHEIPIEVIHEHVSVLREGQSIILSEKQKVEVLETPGHNPGCLSFILGDILFTGDSFIPGHPVITKLKGGDKEQNQHTLHRIEALIDQGMHVYPGHKEIYSNTTLHQFKPLE